MLTKYKCQSYIILQKHLGLVYLRTCPVLFPFVVLEILIQILLLVVLHSLVLHVVVAA